MPSPPSSRRLVLSTVRRLRLALAAVVAGLALAAPASAQALKIGTFDKQRVVDESKLGQAAKDKFEKLQAARESEVDEKQKTYETLKKAYDQQSAVLSDDKKLERQRELARAQDEWQSAAGNADRDLQRAYQSALLDIVQKIDPVIADFAKAEGYDFMFDQTQYTFAKETFDVTQKLITKLDALYGSGTAPAATAPAAKKP
jgi:outer membrane protein